MQRLLFLLFFAFNSYAFAENEFYKPSFSCEKVKSGTVEYKICTDEELSELDVELSEIYSLLVFFLDFIPSNKEKETMAKVKKNQLSWIKSRNACKSISCVTEKYNSRTVILENKMIHTCNNKLKAEKILSNTLLAICEKNILNIRKKELKKYIEVSMRKKLDYALYYFMSFVKSDCDAYYDFIYPGREASISSLACSVNHYEYYIKKIWIIYISRFTFKENVDNPIEAISRNEKAYYRIIDTNRY